MSSTGGIILVTLLLAVKLNEIISRFLAGEDVWDMKNDKIAPAGSSKSDSETRTWLWVVYLGVAPKKHEQESGTK